MFLTQTHEQPPSANPGYVPEQSLYITNISLQHNNEQWRTNHLACPRLHSFRGLPTPILRLCTSGNNGHSQAKSLLCTQGMSKLHPVIWKVECYRPPRLVHGSTTNASIGTCIGPMASYAFCGIPGPLELTVPRLQPCWSNG